MKRIMLSLGILAVTAVSAFAQQPTAGAIVNAGSYAVAGTQNAAIAQGSMFVIFGTNMGPSTIQHAFSYPLPTTLAGTSINITSGSPFHAIMLYTVASQLAAILPSSVPAGPATLTVTYNGQTSAPLSFTVVPSNFGAFTATQAGSGAGIIVDGNGVPYTALRPATPGLQVALYGTGLGPIAGDETTPTAQQKLNTTLQVYVGTQQANVVFEGRAGSSAGNAIDQINFTVPSGVTGCNVPVTVQIGNVVGNFSTLPVSNGGPCSDPGGVPASVLQQVSGKNTFSIGSVFLTNTTTKSTLPGQTTTTTTSGGGAFFARYTLSAFLESPSSSTGSPSIGGCLVTPITSSLSSTSSPLVSYTGLDAGASIGLTGPNGAQTLSKITQVSLPGFYSGTFPASYLTAGSYTATGPGGADVGAFSTSLAVPSPLVWTNAASIPNINRSQGVTITWTGGDPNGYVTITGSSTTTSGTSVLGGTFTCLAPVAAQTFFVPPPVLLSLPASGSFAGVNLPGTLSVGGESYTTFTASGLDFGLFGYLSSSSQSASYQ
jgi:uncharacterized protein (TIGR03437 family)